MKKFDFARWLGVTDEDNHAEERPDACCKIYGEISGIEYR